jgi:hypothetical protein
VICGGDLLPQFRDAVHCPPPPGGAYLSPIIF